MTDKEVFQRALRYNMDRMAANFADSERAMAHARHEAYDEHMWQMDLDARAKISREIDQQFPTHDLSLYGGTVRVVDS